jgi:hypothetical protein
VTNAECVRGSSNSESLREQAAELQAHRSEKLKHNKPLVTNPNAFRAVLPLIPGIAAVPDSWRRVAALHRELSRLCAGKTYFLSCRDTAKAHPGLSHQLAYNINLALAQVGVIKIVRAGDARPNGRDSQFRYLLSESENREAKIAA